MTDAPAPSSNAGAYAAFLLSLTAAVLSLGGLAVLLFLDFPTHRELALPTVVALVSLPAAIVLGLKLRAQDDRRFAFSLILFGFMALVSLLVGNVAASFLIPRWPARGLHGVKPIEGAKTWGNLDAEHVGFNSWGQQDRERTIVPEKGKYRAAFIGDSFMEETTYKLPVRTDDKLNDPGLEVINLGIANTAPDEYFYRVKNIALRLGAKHCYVFLYAGNDFVIETSLPSWGGVAATYPRPSLLTSLHLSAINHVLTNRARPILGAWRNAREVGNQESLKAAMASGDDDQLRAGLLHVLAPEYRDRLAAALRAPGTHAFLDMVRNPDGGLWRSYLIEAAFRCAVGEKTTYLPIDESWAYSWLKRAADACKARGVGFTIVIVPEAFQVDDRMVAQYASIADMRTLFKTRREACDRVAERARKDGIDVIDLHPVLFGTKGTYLNLDGHWSTAGVELVSDVMAREVKKRAAGELN